MPIAQRKIDESDALPGENPRAVIGGNNPPMEELIPAEFQQALTADKPDFLTRLDQLLGKVNPDPEKASDLGSVHRAQCVDEETLGRCGELINSLRKAEQHVGAVHKAVKEPYLQGGRLVDAQKNAFLARIGAGQQRVLELQNEYLREQRRKEQEAEAERQAEIREQDAKRRKLEELARENDIEIDLLPPPPAPPPIARAEPVRSDGGATVSRLTDYRIEIESWPKAIKHVLTDAKVREVAAAALLRIVRATKGAKPLAGVRIIEDVKAGNR